MATLCSLCADPRRGRRLKIRAATSASGSSLRVVAEQRAANKRAATPYRRPDPVTLRIQLSADGRAYPSREGSGWENKITRKRKRPATLTTTFSFIPSQAGTDPAHQLELGGHISASPRVDDTANNLRTTDSLIPEIKTLTSSPPASPNLVSSPNRLDELEQETPPKRSQQVPLQARAQAQTQSHAHVSSDDSMLTVECFLQRSTEKPAPARNYRRKRTRKPTQAAAATAATNGDDDELRASFAHDAEPSSGSLMEDISSDPIPMLPPPEPSKSPVRPAKRGRKHKSRSSGITRSLRRAAILSGGKPGALLRSASQEPSSRPPLEFVPANKFSTPERPRAKRHAPKLHRRRTQLPPTTSIMSSSKERAERPCFPVTAWNASYCAGSGSGSVSGSGSRGVSQLRSARPNASFSQAQAQAQVQTIQHVATRTTDRRPLAFVAAQDAEQAYTAKFRSQFGLPSSTQRRPAATLQPSQMPTKIEYADAPGLASRATAPGTGTGRRLPFDPGRRPSSGFPRAAVAAASPSIAASSPGVELLAASCGMESKQPILSPISSQPFKGHGSPVIDDDPRIDITAAGRATPKPARAFSSYLPELMQTARNATHSAAPRV
ncbi:hypothetical protein CONPUDRAFT_71143 [Coniophora puteana RWD-64-598 SS2]|uniref:Uncharacterized protein n=1 Tax=Coniophora puteana (strain RWD-64-598) TaxID=741705 RepID=A0A5M3MZA6_CONPW|nr:uncharacterized protein CONPUDRAFT_71143 [Coniophora puteana RWD-64-598 SS2]EIW84356.1 hypothetical protein CONPUDRAFT_71143 [Coniophora puteana RWD-64-598 SS2]